MVWYLKDEAAWLNQTVGEAPTLAGWYWQTGWAGKPLGPFVTKAEAMAAGGSNGSVA